MSQNGLNPIQMKVAVMRLDRATFVHPSLDATEVLESQCGKGLYGFSVAGVEYLIDAMRDSQVEGFDSSYTIFVNNGNSWHQGSVRLYSWEWIYLVHGADIVNAEKYFAFSSIVNPSNTEFHSNRERQNAINSQINQEGIEFMESRFSPATIDSDGNWTIEDSDEDRVIKRLQQC